SWRRTPGRLWPRRPLFIDPPPPRVPLVELDGCCLAARNLKLVGPEGDRVVTEKLGVLSKGGPLLGRLSRTGRADEHGVLHEQDPLPCGNLVKLERTVGAAGGVSHEVGGAGLTQYPLVGTPSFDDGASRRGVGRRPYAGQSLDFLELVEQRPRRGN